MTSLYCPWCREEEVPVFPVDEDPAVVEVEVLELEDRAGGAGVRAPAPSRSCATTMPMTTVAPVAASTAPRVNERSRDLVFSLSREAFGWTGGHQFGPLSWGRPYPTILNSTHSQGPLRTC